MLRKHPTFTAVAVLVIALGTGAVSTIYSAANAVVLRPIPGVPATSELVTIDRTRGDGAGTISASYPYYERLAARSHTMAGIAAWSLLPLTMSTGGQGVSALGDIVSGNYFAVLGVRPALGRFFSAEESRVPGAYPVVVLSHGFWQTRLGGDSGVVGKTVLVNGAPYTVIGIAPAGFSGVYPMLRTDAWVPLMMRAQLRAGGDIGSAGSAWLLLFGRLAPGVSRARATIELAALTRQVAADPAMGEPRYLSDFTRARVAALRGVPSEVAGAMIGVFAVLLAAAGLVLAIASANVAGMLLARAVARRRELALRVALGAGRARLVRQLLTESTILFLLGGGGGALLAVLGARLLGRIQLPIDAPLQLHLAPDARVLAVTLAVALATGLAFGLAPALQGSRGDLAGVLRADSAAAGRRRSRLRAALVVGQIATSLLLLTASGLFLRALQRGRGVDIGFDPAHVATTALDVGTAGYDEAHARVLYRELARRLGALPGVTAVGYAHILPLSLEDMGISTAIPGYAPPGGAVGGPFDVSFNDVSDGYLEATRTPLASGRAFAPTDDERAPRVAVVNQTFARRFWPGSQAVGRTFRLDEHLPPPVVTTLRQSIAVALLPHRVASAVSGAMGLLGLVLAAVGLYGVLSFSTAQRTREMGVRIALGAERRDVVRLVVREGMRLVALGMAIGLALSLLAARALTTFLFGVSPADPAALLGTSALLMLVAYLAAWLPARRAASVDPMEAMRQD